jgi:hypothetical protein
MPKFYRIPTEMQLSSRMPKLYRIPTGNREQNPCPQVPMQPHVNHSINNLNNLIDTHINTLINKIWIGNVLNIHHVLYVGSVTQYIYLDKVTDH